MGVDYLTSQKEKKMKKKKHIPKYISSLLWRLAKEESMATSIKDWFILKIVTLKYLHST